MHSSKQLKSERQYYLDWLRIILILTVFLFHIGMIFNTFGWHIKNEEQFPGLAPIMSFLHLWRMPLLFLISGAGTYYALGRRSGKQYLKERTRRLLLPLVAGIFILVPVQVYIERIDQYHSLLDYYTHMFDGVYPSGNFSWHHLWFIAYLYLISLLISPFLKYFQSKSFRRFKLELEKLVRQPAGMNLIILPLLITQLLLKPYFPRETHDIVNDWAFIVYNLTFFMAGFILFVNPRIIHYLKRQRRIYFSEAIIASTIWFVSRYYWHLPSYIDELINITVAWSCSVTAIAYAACKLNRNSNLRKQANQAIYPFYLVHQPVIIGIGYFIIQWNIAVLEKATLVLIFSFLTSSGIYWYLVRPYNGIRILFGMKKRRTTQKQTTVKAAWYGVLNNGK